MHADLQQLRQWFGCGAWCVDFTRVVGSALLIGGWIESPDADCRPTVRVNGQPVDWITRGIRLPNLGEAFPFLPAGELGGFRARKVLGAAELAAPDALVECIDERNGEPLWPAQNVWAPMAGAIDSDVALPSAMRVARISGSNSVDLFRLEGASMARKLAQTCARFGVPLARGIRLLDWGVGCGRLARFLSRIDGVAYVGIDVDADNIGWCATTLAGGEYRAVALLPPTPLASECCDVVVGMSVVTHLRESVHLQWLAELARIVQPLGVVLLSVHGEQAASRGLRGSESIAEWRDRGFVFGKQRHALDALLNDATYYGTAFHHPSYVRSRWSQWFDVLEIIPAAIGNHQDLVVLRRKAGEHGLKSRAGNR